VRRCDCLEADRRRIRGGIESGGPQRRTGRPDDRCEGRVPKPPRAPAVRVEDDEEPDLEEARLPAPAWPVGDVAREHQLLSLLPDTGKEETRVPTDPWKPEQYERFREERSRPFLDLLELVRPRPGMRVVDLGCGTGELTRALHERIGSRETLGIDSSPAMLARSAAFAGAGLRFERVDVAQFAGRDYDLVFSNAALHWVPHHEALFVRLTEALTAGGQLAVQMPANFDHPSHVVAAEIRRHPEFRDALEGSTDAATNVLSPERYAALLERLGYVEQHVRL